MIVVDVFAFIGLCVIAWASIKFLGRSAASVAAKGADEVARRRRVK